MPTRTCRLGSWRYMRAHLEWDVLFVLEEDDLRRAPDIKHYRLAQQLRRTLVTHGPRLPRRSAIPARRERRRARDQRARRAPVVSPVEPGRPLDVPAPTMPAARRFPSRAASCTSTPTGDATPNDRPSGAEWCCPIASSSPAPCDRRWSHRRHPAGLCPGRHRIRLLPRPLHRSRVHRCARPRHRRRRFARRGRAMAEMAARLPRYGVTAFCPTTVACAPRRCGACWRRCRSAREPQARGGASAARTSRKQLHQPGVRRAARADACALRARRWTDGPGAGRAGGAGGAGGSGEDGEGEMERAEICGNRAGGA